MKSLTLVITLISALCLRAGVTANTIDSKLETNRKDELPYVYELEDGPMPITDVHDLENDFYRTTYQQKTKGSIQRIIGAIEAELLDRRGFKSEVACYAQNSDDLVFRALGNHARHTQNRAFQKCFHFRSVCKPLGCTTR